MSYHELEHLIQDGDIIFVRSKGTFLHNIITYFTTAPQIHCGIAFWIEMHGKRHLLMLETNGGARRRLISVRNYKECDIDVLEAPVKWEEIAHIALDHLGDDREYGWIEAIYVGITETVERVFGVRLPKYSFDSEICSKLVADIIKLESTEMSPAKLYDKLRQLGIKRKLKIRRSIS